jgi:uncharacterized protein (TIRG00374 family)
MASKTKRIGMGLLKASVAVGLIALMVHKGYLDPSKLKSLMTPLNVVVALLLIGTNNFFASWRWVILLRGSGLRLSVGYGFSSYLMGQFFNYALPGAVGGDVVRAYYVAVDYPERRMDSVLSIALDRILGLYSFFILTLIAVVCDFNFVMGHEKIHWVAKMCLLLFIGMTVFFTITFSERLSRKFGLTYLARKIPVLHKVVEDMHRFGENPQAVAWSILVSFLGQFFTMIFFYQVAMALGETDITWRAVLFAVPMGFLVTAIPIAPAGIGVAQVAFQYLFEAYLQRPTPLGATAVTAFQIVAFTWSLVGAAFYLARKKPQNQAAMNEVAEIT